MASSITVTNTTNNTALVPWTEVMAGIQAQASDFATVQPQLQVGMAMGGMGAGLSFTWSITPQKLDEILRPSIPGLPTLGLYTVAVLPGDPTNALSVTWTSTTPPA